MAQTSTRKSSSGSRTQRSNGSTSSSSRGGGRSNSKGARKPKSRSSRASTKGRSRTGGSSRKGTSRGSSRPASTAKQVASKVKGPAIAGGAALLGVAGGIALGSQRNSGRKVLGMRMSNGVGQASKNLADASKNVGRFGDNLGQFAAEMQRTREVLESGSKGRSPVEVVLRALTARR